jgi:2-dehydro-3-deoxygluconokinase
MAAVVTFGEAMLRLSPPDHRRFEQAHALEVWPAGAELNVAVGLARLGTRAAWVSRLPRNALGRLVAAHARSHGVDLSGVRWDNGGRLGLYFVEVAPPPRPSVALYDRAGSSFATSDPSEYDWPSLLADARFFHTTGITLALSDRCARAVDEAVAAAEAIGCQTSFDLNFRARLTTPARAREHVERLAGSLDVLLSSADDIARVFDLRGDPLELAGKLREGLGLAHVVVSARVPGEDGALQRLSVSAGEETHIMTSATVGSVEPIGGGDAFCAGFLHGLLEEGPRRGLELGGAMAALKQSVPGDFPIVERDEVAQLLGAPGTVRMSR